ncbi:MAG: glycoside hydrolase family 31 protein [Prevotella sp.]|nr:glycoside hydrolase family 31 protein [Prevotella sp.]
MANPKAVVLSGNARFTVLTPEMIRIQYSGKQLFEDRATFAVVNRNLPVPAFTQTTENGYLTIKTSALTLRYKLGSEINPAQRNAQSLSITFRLNGRDVMWFPGKEDALNLKGTTRTLDGAIGDSKRSELEDGLLSRSGWALVDESPRTKRGDGSTTFAFDKNVDGIEWFAEPVDKDAIDWYFMGYGHRYKTALADFTKVAGKMPMPPLYILGYWYSKYQRYTAQDFMNIANEIQANKIPLDVMIFDMDWHTKGWTGWTWDKSIIPDPEGLIKFMHDKQLKVGLNLHPADGVDDDEEYFQDMVRDMRMPADTKVVPWQLEDSTFYRVMFRNILRKREAQGVDFWWLDWQQNLTNPRVAGLGETFWCNHVFYNDMRLNRKDHRPVIFHRWGGLGSHRYPIGFSGDSFTTFGTLAFEPYFTSTASNVCFGYWGHDLGGHQQFDGNDPELYLRWCQYGVFTPVFRTHATNWEGIERRIWKYDNFSSLLKTVNLRYALMPYIYNAARMAYDTGISICRPLYYDSPEDNNAYRFEDEYMFGSDILVAPVVSRSGKDGRASRTTWLPEGRWFDVCRNQLIDGGKTFTDSYALEEIPYFYKAGSIIVNYPHVFNLKSRPETLVLKVVPGKDGKMAYYEDNGDDEGYKNNEYTTTDLIQTRTDDGVTLKIMPRVGAFAGMPELRSYQAEFLCEDKPAQVVVNGTVLAADGWSYNAATRTVTVVLSKVGFEKMNVITLKKA